jgi:hypothetical protein
MGAHKSTHRSPICATNFATDGHPIIFSIKYTIIQPHRDTHMDTIFTTLVSSNMGADKPTN